MIELHYYPGNASFTPHVLLNELGVPFTLRRVDREAGAHKQAEYLKLNPNGAIPVLVEGDLVLYETAAICLHLADTHPEARLMPPLGTHARAHAYKWLMWATNTLQATLMHYFYPERMVDAGNGAGADQVKAHAQAKVAGLLDIIDTHLQQQAAQGAGAGATPWFLGADYSVLDPYIFMLCRWTRGFDHAPARNHAYIAPYLQRVLQRPAVRQAFEAEGLSEPWY